MPVTRVALLAASGAAISAVCLTFMAVTAVSMGYFGPEPTVAAPPAEPAPTAALLIAPTPPPATRAR